MIRLPSLSLFTSLLVSGIIGPVTAAEPKRPDPADAFRQLGKLRAGFAYRAREDEHAPIKAAFFSLQAAQAFQHVDAQLARKHRDEGRVAAQALRASWGHRGFILAMGFLPGDKQVLTCGSDGMVHVWVVATGREIRSFRALSGPANAEARAASLNQDRSRLVIRDWRTLQLWDLNRERLLRKWDRAMERTREGEQPIDAGAVFIDCGRRLLLWGTKNPAEVWDTDGKKQLHVIDKGAIRDGATVYGEGTRLLTSDRSTIYLWDLTNGKLMRTFEVGAAGWSVRYRFSPDGTRILLIAGDEGKEGWARLIDIATGKELSRFATRCLPGAGKQRVSAGPAVFSPDGTRLLTWGKDRAIELWDVEQGRRQHTFGRGSYLSARFLRDGTQVLTVGDPVRLWDAKTGKVLGRYGNSDSDPIFTHDGKRLLLSSYVAYASGALEVWDVKDEKRLMVLNTPGVSGDLQLSADGSLLLTRAWIDGAALAQLWDLAQPHGGWNAQEDVQPRARVFKHVRPVRGAVLSRDGTRLLTCDESGRAFLWDAVHQKPVRSFDHGAGILGVTFDPDESHVLTWGEKGVVKLWDTSTGKQVRTFDHPADVQGATFSPDGSHLLTRDADYTVWWWDVARPRPVHQFEHTRAVYGARLSPDGKRVLTWGFNGKVHIWDLASGREVRALAHDGPVFGVTFAGVDRLWTCSTNGLREWDLTKGKVLRQQKPPDGVALAELAPDGQRFLLRTAEGMAQLWDVRAEKVLVQFETARWESFGIGEHESAGAFSRDQTRVLTWPNGSVYLFDLASGVRLKWFHHPGGARGVAFSPSERSVLTWGADGTARLWDASVPRTLSCDDQLLELEVRSGLQLGEDGHLWSLRGEEWMKRSKKLETILKKKGR